MWMHQYHAILRVLYASASSPIICAANEITRINTYSIIPMIRKSFFIDGLFLKPVELNSTLNLYIIKCNKEKANLQKWTNFEMIHQVADPRTFKIFLEV